MTVSNVEENQGKLGRLKKILKVRNPFVCSDCMKEIEVGNPCYTQSDYTSGGFFPIQKRICVDCGQIQINNGIEIKEKSKKKKKKKNKNSIGCGRDTKYPKPDKDEMWKCGEETLIGYLFCDECLDNFTLNSGIQDEI